VIGRCLALGRLLVEFSLTPGTPSFLGQNAARKVVGRRPRSSLATWATMFKQAFRQAVRIGVIGLSQPQEKLRNS